MDELGFLLLRAGVDGAGILARQPGPGRLYSAFDLDDVIQAMTRLIAEDEANIRARFLRGAAYQAQQRYPEALADFDALLKQDPNHARTLLLRSELHFELGEKASGLADRQSALRLDPSLA